MKLDFSNVIFTDECRVTLDGTDGWHWDWILYENYPPGIMRRQHGAIIIWAGILDNRIISLFKVDDGVKMNSVNYTTFLDKNFFLRYNAQSRSLKLKSIFIYSRRRNYWRLVFFIILYPYFTLKGLIFILEVKFQSFLAEPTHMPDLSSE